MPAVVFKDNSAYFIVFRSVIWQFGSSSFYRIVIVDDVQGRLQYVRSVLFLYEVYCSVCSVLYVQYTVCRAVRSVLSSTQCAVQYAVCCAAQTCFL
jgi:hypothetical protein